MIAPDAGRLTEADTRLREALRWWGNSGDLWSVADVLEFAASRLTGLMDLVSVWSVSLGMAVASDTSVNVADPVWESTRQQIRKAAEFCDDIGLVVSADCLRQLEANFKPDSETWPREQQTLFRDARARIQSEIKGRKLLMIAMDRARYYETTPLFGELVEIKLPTTSEDIENAGKCLALEQGTACVFHLMRAMEIAVQRLARRLKVKVDPSKDTWDQIVGSINGAVRQMPRKTAAQRNKHAKVAAAAAHLHTVRIAWRNEVMHPKQTYTVEEATRIFNAVDGFMRDLAEFI